MLRRFFLFVLVGFVLFSCQQSPAQQQAQRQRNVDRLSQSFSALEQLQVQAYRNQDWCKNIFYRRGKFSNNIDRSTCNLFAGTPQPFDAQAQQDFATIEQAIAATGVKLLYISTLKYTANRSLSGADFTLEGGSEYVYEPAYTLPENIPNEREYTAVNSDWYFVSSDWN